MGEHAPLSPSSMDRILSCPASVNLSKDYEEVVSEYAIEGTKAHEELEQCLLMGTDSNNEYIQTAIDYVRKRQAEGMEVLVETKVFPKQLGRDDCWGTADIIMYDEANTEIEIADFKYGQGVVVEAADNRQLQTYLLGALTELVPDGTIIPKKLTTTIIQPRIEHTDGPIRTVTYTFDELAEFIGYAKRRLALIDESEPVFGPSSKACKWCPARRDCSHRASKNLAELGLSFDPVIKTEDLPQAGKLTMDQRVQILDTADEIHAWLSDVTDGAIELLKKFEDVPHYKLVRGRSNRRWKESDDETIEQLKSMGFKVKEIMATKLASPSAIERVIKVRKMKEAKRNQVAALIEKPEGKLTLAHETDSRPAAIMPKPEKPFEDVSQVDELASLLS